MLHLKFLKPTLDSIFSKNVETKSNDLDYIVNRDIDLSSLRIVVAYSLYDNAEKYITAFRKNCELINEAFPNFWIYLFIGNDFDHSILDNLHDISNLKIIETGFSGHKNMAMRFTTIDYEEVGIAFSRDCDSYVNRRDKYCMTKFIESDKKFQIIRENMSHYTEILGGMWGIKQGLLGFKIKDKIDQYYKNIAPGYGDDQRFLTQEIYYHVRPYSQVFDEFFHFPGETPQKIDTGVPWNSYNHVGAAVMYNKDADCLIF
jgi:hypothetical protein